MQKTGRLGHSNAGQTPGSHPPSDSALNIHSYNMPPQRFPGHWFVAAAEAARSRLETFGVRQPAGHRLQKAEALIRDVNSGRVPLTPDEPLALRRVTNALHRIFEQYIVLRWLNRSRPFSSTMITKLETMLSGHEISWNAMRAGFWALVPPLAIRPYDSRRDESARY